MTERWVVNASPVIVLAKINQLALLFSLADSVVLPEAVADEIRMGPADDPAVIALETKHFRIVTADIHPSVQAWDLGRGETAVLSYARHHRGWKAVVDDAAARRCARALDISVIGTLGIILRARKQGLIPEAAPLLRELKAKGFRLHDDVIRAALWETVGEHWP